MIPTFRKFSLTMHLIVSIGWIGAAAAYLVLVFAAMRTDDTQTLRAAWVAMDLIGWRTIVPFATASLVTGVIMSLATPWGLFRHYWVVASLVLTLVATGVLVRHMQSVSVLASAAERGETAGLGELRHALRSELLHAGVGLLVLCAIATLNVYKPAGLTSFGRSAALRTPSVAAAATATPKTGMPARTRTPLWVRVVGLHAAALALLLVILHVTGGGLKH